jgi:hypothetical protein
MKQSGKTLAEIRAEERERYIEIQTALVRSHFQARMEERAIQLFKEHDAIEKLKRLREQGVKLPGVKE